MDYRPKLTERQQELLNYIREYMATRHRAPSRREIGAFFGFQPAAAQHHIKALIRKGYLDKKPKKMRSLMVTDYKWLPCFKLPTMGTVLEDGSCHLFPGLRAQLVGESPTAAPSTAPPEPTPATPTPPPSTPLTTD